MSRRLQGVVVGVVVGTLFAGGIAYAVTVLPPNDTDRYYACVGVLGKVRQDTVRFDSPPTSCPKAADTVRSWNAQGPQGIQGQQGGPGEQGQPGLAGPPGIGGIQVIESATLTLDPNQGGTTVYVPCPADTIVISGGFTHSGNPSGTGVTTNAPNGNRWQVSIVNSYAGTTVQAFAICATLAS